MKKAIIHTLVITAVLVALKDMSGQSVKPVPPMSTATKQLMQQKLAASQKALEGITMEDFPLVAAQARKLLALSHSADWPAFGNPEYAENVNIFRRNVAALAKAADDRNLDGVTLAYVKMTMNCVECHKLVRGRKLAGLRYSDTVLQSALQKSWQTPNLSKAGP